LRLAAGLEVVRNEDLVDSELVELSEDVDQFARAQRLIARSTAEVMAPIGPGSPDEDDEDDDEEDDDDDELDEDTATDGTGEGGRSGGPR
jgi:hypothetical protein